MLLFEDLEKLVKEATAPEQAEPEREQSPDTLVEKLANTLEDEPAAGNSKLGVAKVLMSLDILSS